MERPFLFQGRQLFVAAAEKFPDASVQLPEKSNGFINNGTRFVAAAAAAARPKFDVGNKHSIVDVFPVMRWKSLKHYTLNISNIAIFTRVSSYKRISDEIDENEMAKIGECRLLRKILQIPQLQSCYFCRFWHMCSIRPFHTRLFRFKWQGGTPPAYPIGSILAQKFCIRQL